MARFVKHEPCPSCGSRDNLGRYSDGSAFCFGCHYTERSTHSPFVGERDGKNETNTDGIRFPEDATRDLDARAVDWITSFGLSGRDIVLGGFKWSSSWEQLCIPFYDIDGNLCCIQSKNFNHKRASKAKYYNIGDKSESVTRYGNHGTTLVLVEDALSALKIGRQTDAMPLLGTSIPRSRLASLKASYEQLIIWLDSDKWREARAIADAAALLGFKAKTVFTPKDPKTYTDEEIREFLT